MAYDGDPNLGGTILKHLREIGGEEAVLEVAVDVLGGEVRRSRGRNHEASLLWTEARGRLAELRGRDAEARKLRDLGTELMVRYPAPERRG